LLSRNLSANNVNAKLHEVAIGEKDGKATIYLSSHAPWHSLFRPEGKPLSVNQRSLDSLANGKRYDVIKFDIEGSELGLIRGGEKTLLSAKCLAGELHENLLTSAEMREVRSWLEKHFDVEYRTGPPTVVFVAYRK